MRHIISKHLASAPAAAPPPLARCCSSFWLRRRGAACDAGRGGGASRFVARGVMGIGANAGASMSRWRHTNGAPVTRKELPSPPPPPPSPPPPLPPSPPSPAGSPAAAALALLLALLLLLGLAADARAAASAAATTRSSSARRGSDAASAFASRSGAKRKVCSRQPPQIQHALDDRSARRLVAVRVDAARAEDTRVRGLHGRCHTFSPAADCKTLIWRHPLAHACK